MKFAKLFLISILFTGLSTTVVAAQPAQADELIWTGCGISRYAFMGEMATAFEKKTGIKINLSGGGATRGIRGPSTGAAHIGGSCRVALDQLEEERDAYQIPVGWDALVVITHKDNPVDSISFDQLKDLFLGKVKNWKELGGNDAPVEVYARRGKISGVGRTLRELVFHNFDQDFKVTHIMDSTGPLERAISTNVNGVGVTGVSSARKREDIKILQLDKFDPTYDNIKSGQYVLYRPLYIVVKRGQVDERVREFVSFAVSREGQDIIRSQGTVPYTEAMSLVMKQLDQYYEASQAGAYQTDILPSKR